MKKKITISIEEDRLQYAEKEAAEENRTLSNFIETLLIRDEIALIHAQRKQQIENGIFTDKEVQ